LITKKKCKNLSAQDKRKTALRWEERQSLEKKRSEEKEEMPYYRATTLAMKREKSRVIVHREKHQKKTRGEHDSAVLARKNV